VIVVVYSVGTDPYEIFLGLEPLGDLVFATTSPSRATATLLAEFGDVVVLDGDVEADAGRLAGWRPDAVVTFGEHAVATAASLATRLGLPGHDAATVRLLTDKRAQRERLRERGVDMTRNHAVPDLESWPAAVAAVGLPAVLKPARGAGSRDTHLVTATADGERLVHRLLTEPGAGPLVLEEYLVGRSNGPFGDHISVESAVSDGRVAHVAVTGKFPLAPPFRETGQFWPSHLPAAEEDEIRTLAARAIEALGITTGMTHTEIRLTPAGPRLIEVNGRLGGHTNELSRRATGFDLVTVAGRIAVGERVEPRPRRPAEVFFQYTDQAPPYPCRLVEVRGADAVRRVPGVSTYRSYVRAGTELGGGVARHSLDMICGHASDHPSLLSTVAAAVDVLSFVLDTPAGLVELSAAELAVSPAPARRAARG